METKHKTLAECKDEVAKEWNYNDYADFTKQTRLHDDVIGQHIQLMTKASELYAGQTKQLDNFCPAGLPENDPVERIVGIMYSHKSDESDEGAWISSEDFYKVAGYISTALKQPKQLERTHCDENPVEFMRGKINEYFHDWRKSHTDSTIIEIDGPTLGEITFKAEMETKKKFPWIKFKQSYSVNLEVETVIDLIKKSIPETTSNTPIYQCGVSDGKRQAIDIILQSQQPVSIAWLNEEEIKTELDKLSISSDAPQIKVDGAIWMQSELRKRVIDPDVMLNDVLNGFVSGKYKQPKDSNSIAQFVIDYLKTK